MLNLDTHILIDFARGNLESSEKKIIEHHAAHLAISDIVFWEIAKLCSKKRIEIDLSSAKMKKLLQFITVIPISKEIAEQSINLDFSSDPADEIIAATSIVNKIPLLTRDQRILKSKLIAWP